MPLSSSIKTTVFNRFARKKPDAVGLADTLATRGGNIYRNGIDRSLNSFGLQLPDSLPLSKTVEKQVRQRAVSSSKSVTETWNRRLPKIIDDVEKEWIKDHGSLSGLNSKTLAARVRTKQAEYFEWKSKEVANTEFGTFFNTAVFDFIDRNNLEAEVLIMPADASNPARDTDPICATFAGQWRNAKDPLVRSLPVHVNCVVPGAMVSTEDGPVPIEELVPLAFVQTTGGLAEVSQVFERRHLGLVYRLSIGGRVVELTGEHPVLTRDGWKAVQDISVGEEILVAASCEGACGHDKCCKE